MATPASMLRRLFGLAAKSPAIAGKGLWAVVVALGAAFLGLVIGFIVETIAYVALYAYGAIKFPYNGVASAEWQWAGMGLGVLVSQVLYWIPWIGAVEFPEQTTFGTARFANADELKP